tara:strand:- start:472 stop:615 length:144 start_codon:yes stop_codon:yes gene_type:complete
LGAEYQLFLSDEYDWHTNILKNGLAKTDNGFDYKHYKRFLKYEETAP